MSSVDTHLNVVALVGCLHRPPQIRVLKSGEAVTNFDVKVKDADGSSVVLPVSWFDAPTAASNFTAGEAVAVVGSVRRQWYGGGGNFTDVVALSVTPVRSGAKVRKVLAQAMAMMQEAAP